jgi:hypothetical protein
MIFISLVAFTYLKFNSEERPVVPLFVDKQHLYYFPYFS